MELPAAAADSGGRAEQRPETQAPTRFYAVFFAGAFFTAGAAFFTAGLAAGLATASPAALFAACGRTLP